MAMARVSLVRSSLAWLHEMQQMYRTMAPAGVTFPVLVLTSGQPDNWLCDGIPYAVVGRWYEVTPLVLRGV